LAQLEQLEIFLVSKRKLAKKYQSFFEKTDIQFIPEPQNSKSNYWLNCILLKDKIARDEFLKYTNENGVMTRPSWQLISKLTMYKNCQKDNLRSSNTLAEKLVNIPSSVK
jgi:dTDP-4-amino-4,6-dideoxygalactose transaminase